MYSYDPWDAPLTVQVSLPASPPAQMKDGCNWNHLPTLVFLSSAWQRVDGTSGNVTLFITVW